jgi:CoA:oxalate CoA-transferase
MPEKGLPLDGVRIIDLGQIYQGPYATLMMALAGADVIKVEPPHGEPIRQRATRAGAPSLPLIMLNSNKRFVTLNLKSDRGRELLFELARRGDVLLENFAPGVMDRLGVGYEVMRKVNPRLIYASASGYGSSGPDRDALAMDLTVQAYSGIMSITGEPGSPPLKAGPAVVDFISGTHLYSAVVTALFARERSGEGRLVEVAMQDSVFPSLTSNLGLAHGGAVPRTGNRHGGLAIAPYNVYEAKDGHVAVICVTEAHWRNLLKLMGREDLADDPRFIDNKSRTSNMAETDRLVEAWTRTMGKFEIYQATRACKLPSAPVRSLTEVIDDKSMHDRGMLVRIDHPELGEIVLPHSPLRYPESQRLELITARDAGSDNEEVYGELLGLDTTEVAALRENGVI